MLHTYEIRRLENEGKTHIVKRLTEKPKIAKREFRKYAKENPGAYALYKIKRVAACFVAEKD